MNRQIAKVHWKEFKGNLKGKLGKLTDDDSEETKGNSDQSVGKIQKRCSHSLQNSLKMVNESHDSFNKYYN